MHQVFSLLAGKWEIERRIFPQGSMQGVASFEKKAHANGILYYHEEGSLQLADGKPLSVYRDYIYAYEENKIIVYFAENATTKRILHVLQFTSGEVNNFLFTATAQHHCKADIYNVTYGMLNANEFTIVYYVDGPKKAYNINTYYRRISIN